MPIVLAIISLTHTAGGDRFKLKELAQCHALSAAFFHDESRRLREAGKPAVAGRFGLPSLRRHGPDHQRQGRSYGLLVAATARSSVTVTVGTVFESTM